MAGYDDLAPELCMKWVHFSFLLCVATYVIVMGCGMLGVGGDYLFGMGIYSGIGMVVIAGAIASVGVVAFLRRLVSRQDEIIKARDTKQS